MKNEETTLTAAGKEVIIAGIGNKINDILYRTHSDKFLVSKLQDRSPLHLEMHQALPLNC